VTTIRMLASGAGVVLAFILIGDGLVATIVIGLAGLGLLLLTMSSGPQWRARDIDGNARLGGEKTTAPTGPNRSRPKRIRVFH
jgi:hypothetical protein